MTVRKFPLLENSEGFPTETFNQNDSNDDDGVSLRYYIKDILETIGWDIIELETAIEDGVPLIKINNTTLAFCSFDNIVNILKIQMVAAKLSGDSHNNSSAQN